MQSPAWFTSLHIRHVLVMATHGLISLSISYLSLNENAFRFTTHLSPKPLFSESLKGLASIVGTWTPTRISRKLRLLSFYNICRGYLTSLSPIVGILHQKTASFLLPSTLHGMQGVECVSAPLRLFPWCVGSWTRWKQERRRKRQYNKSLIYSWGKRHASKKVSQVMRKSSNWVIVACKHCRGQ